MPIPAGVTTATVHHDAPVSFSGDPGRVMARFTPSTTLIWDATGTPLARFFDAVSPGNGESMEIDLPHTDQSGFLDGSGNALTNWHYSVDLWYFKDGQKISFPSRDFQLSTGQSSVDLALIPFGEAADPTVAPLAYVTSVNGQTGDIEIESLLGPEGPEGPAGPEGPEGPAGPIVPLDSLTDVTAPSPSDGQALVWNSSTSRWVNGSTIASALDSLSDVTAPSPADGQALVWDSTTSKWVNETPASTLDSLTDVTAPSPSDGQALIWDNATSAWKNTTLPTPSSTLDSLTDVTAPTPSNGQALIWDSATSLWKNTTLSAGATTLDGLTDVTAPSPSNGQALIWDSATSQWKNAAIPAAPITVIAKTANYTLTTADDAVTFNGSSLTATIPDPTTCATKVFRIKNLHATALSVVSAGTSKTIDGAASVNVWQYQSLTVVSDGATWYIVAGREFVPSSTYKPFINDSTSGTGTTFKVWTNISSTEPAIWADSSGVANRPAFRATVYSGTGNIIEAGAWIGGGFYKYFNVDPGGTINKISNVDFTITAGAANPQDKVATTYGVVTDTNPGLTYLKRAAGTSWNYQPFGYFGQPQTKTANYTVDFRDTLLIGNGSNITFTLPDPTASGLTAGRKFEFKNIHSTNLTLVSAGTSKTIDGAASVAMAQWDKITVITDGAQWLIMGATGATGATGPAGHNPVTVSTTAPSSPVNGDIWFDIS